MKKQIVAMMIMVSSLIGMSAQAEQVDWKPRKLESKEDCDQSRLVEGRCTYNLMAAMTRRVVVDIPGKSVFKVSAEGRDCYNSITVTDQDHHQTEIGGERILEGNGEYYIQNRSFDLCRVTLEVINR